MTKIIKVILFLTAIIFPRFADCQVDRGELDYHISSGYLSKEHVNVNIFNDTLTITNPMYTGKQIYYLKTKIAGPNQKPNLTQTFLYKRPVHTNNKNDSTAIDEFRIYRDSLGEILLVEHVFQRSPKSNQYRQEELWFSIKGYSQAFTNYLDGRKYYHIMYESCSELVGGGGYMTYGHCYLKFSGNNVQVAQVETRNTDLPKLKKKDWTTYQYTIKGNKIVVKRPYFNLFISSPIVKIVVSEEDSQERGRPSNEIL